MSASAVGDGGAGCRHAGSETLRGPCIYAKGGRGGSREGEEVTAVVRGPQTSSVKSQIVDTSGFLGHRTIAATDSMERNELGRAALKLYSHRLWFAEP